MKEAVGVLYSKNVGSKKVQRIRTVGSLVEKIWQIEVHLHRECYGNCENWHKNLANCCNSLKFFTANVFYCTVATISL